MKILYVTTISNTVNAFLIPHIELLIKDGHQVDVAFNTEQEVNPQVYKMGCKVHQVPFQRSPIKKDNLKSYKILKNIIISESYDLVHTHTPIASAIVRLACRKLINVKVFYTAHGFHFFKGAPKKNWLIYYPVEKLFSRFTDVLITINAEDYKLAIDNKFKAKKIELVPGIGINLKKFSPQTEQKKRELRKEYSYNMDDFILIYVGELSYRKHQDALIRMVDNLKRDIPNLKLLLVGGGNYYEEYLNLIDSLELTNFVYLLGYRSDVAELMSLADIAMSSSRQEGLPVNIMEAMAVGLPLVVSDCRGNRDLVRTFENGFLITKENSYSEYVLMLYRDRELRKKLSSGSLKKISTFDLEQINTQMSIIYKSQLNIV